MYKCINEKKYILLKIAYIQNIKKYMVQKRGY